VAADIDLQGVSKTYGRKAGAVAALCDVTLSIAAGEFAVLTGPSGSGKSTCLSIIGCLDTPTKGTYRLGGVDVGGLSADSRARLRRRIGFVFQSFNLLPRLSALDNVALPLAYRSVPRRERTGRARRALEQVGLADRASHRPAELSGGQQQRVAIARALVGEPELIVADEPTGNLDSTLSQDILGCLRDLNRRLAVTVLLSTHDPALIEAYDRTVAFRDGCVA
jgi:putative ABC transport system ATP-binding protein